MTGRGTFSPAVTGSDQPIADCGRRAPEFGDRINQLDNTFAPRPAQIKSTNLFDHPAFDRYAFEDVPLNRDIYLCDERDLVAYESMMIGVFDKSGSYLPPGPVAFAAARRITEASIELSWYANVFQRFHEVLVTLPRSEFRDAVGSWQFGEKPHVFVSSEWLSQIHLRSNSVFAQIDVANFGRALQADRVSRTALIRLRDQTDSLAARHLDKSFISFGDSLLIKSNWSAGHFDSGTRYSYDPEAFIHVFGELQAVYQDALGLKIYGVIAQGSNTYYDDALLHISQQRNHICLNSLGLPFAQIQAIENAVRKAIRARQHSASDLYMDELFFRSLKFKFEFDKKAVGRQTYTFAKFKTDGAYLYADYPTIRDNLNSAGPIEALPI